MRQADCLVAQLEEGMESPVRCLEPGAEREVEEVGIQVQAHCHWKT
jgi:hypothetical protein